MTLRDRSKVSNWKPASMLIYEAHSSWSLIALIYSDLNIKTDERMASGQHKHVHTHLNCSQMESFDRNKQKTTENLRIFFHERAWVQVACSKPTTAYWMGSHRCTLIITWYYTNLPSTKPKTIFLLTVYVMMLPVSITTCLPLFKGFNAVCTIDSAGAMSDKLIVQAA